MKKILKVENLSYKIKDELAVKGAEFNLYKGDVALLEGNNGSGKTTFFNILIRNYNKDIISIEEGSIKYNENDIFQTDIGKLRASISYLSQTDEGIRNYSVWEMLKFYASNVSGISNKEINAMVEDWYDKFLKESIESHLKKRTKGGAKRIKFNRLSGGQKKMVHIAAMLIKAELSKTGLILLDEPLNNLDAENKKKVSNMISEIKDKQNSAVIIITHCNIFPSVNKKILLNNKEMKIFDLTEGQSYYKCLGAVDENNRY